MSGESPMRGLELVPERVVGGGGPCPDCGAMPGSSPSTCIVTGRAHLVDPEAVRVLRMAQEAEQAARGWREPR